MKFFVAALLIAIPVSAGTAVNLYGAPPGGNGVAVVTSLAPAPLASSALASSALASSAFNTTDGLDPQVLALALTSTRCAIDSGTLTTVPSTLTVIDYSKPSTAERLWVFDTTTHALLYHELVAHGQGSGENLATHFSNDDESHQSSLGLFVTEDTYTGKNGYSLRLRGLEPGFNDHAYARAIVMHGASYVSASFAREQGRLGRSWGCPALREPIARDVIDRVKHGGVVFAYSPDSAWLAQSRFLHTCTGPQQL